MYLRGSGSYPRHMSQRKLPPESTARQAVGRAARGKAEAGDRLVLVYQRTVGRARAKAVARIKREPAPKPQGKSEDVQLPKFVGMLRGAPSDLAARAKDIVRGVDDRT